MMDAKIRIKSLGSLARRAVLASLALLVIPLLLHSLFLYRNEYESSLIDAKENLALIARAEQSILQERIELEWDILDALAASDLTQMQKLNVFEMSPPSNAADHFAVINVRRATLVVGKKISERRSLAMATHLDQLFEDRK